MLFIRPIQGYLTRETNLLLTMDPYLLLIYEGQQFKTTPHFSGGNKPKWSETFSFEAKTLNKLKVEAWSRAVIGSDSLIGKGEIDLRKLPLAPGQAFQQYAELLFEGKPAGKILVEIALTALATKKKPIFQQKESQKEAQKFRSSLPELPSLNQMINHDQNNKKKQNAKQQNRQIPAPESNSNLLFSLGSPENQKQVNKKHPNVQPHQKMASQKQLPTQVAKTNINDKNSEHQNKPKNILQNGAIKSPGHAQGLPHNHMQRPLSPPHYQHNYPLKHRLNNGVLVPQKLNSDKVQHGQYQLNKHGVDNLSKQDSEMRSRNYNEQRHNHQHQVGIFDRKQKQRVGIGKTPPKSILSPGKGRKSKSNKKVTWNV